MIPKGIKAPLGDVKDNIDKTVEYVLKNGESFEERLKSNPEKFPFIVNGDEFYQYYEWKLGRLPQDNSIKDASNELSIPVEEAKEEKVEDLEFLVNKGTIPPIDYETMKLSALFVARNGPNYLKPLHSHLSGSRQFDFLSPNHSYHPLFKQLVTQYEKTIDIISNPQPLPKRDLFKDSYLRAKYSKRDKLKEESESQKFKERQLQYASIDWQDFTVVGKIEFNSVDQVIELPASLKREDLIRRSLEERSKGLELQILTAPAPEEPTVVTEEKEDVVEPVPKGIVPGKIRSAGESRLKKTKTKTIICPITGKHIEESKFDEHLKILLRDPNYLVQKQNYINKNFKYGSNLNDDEVYENIKRLTKKRSLE